ncbi:MAG TPA: DUF3592 domain-containing protein [Chthoniobacteraceae bacterium]|jgi:hypothetical protein
MGEWWLVTIGRPGERMSDPAKELKRDLVVGAALFVVTGIFGYALTGSVRYACVIGACVGVIGIGISLVGIRELRKALASRHWAPAPGRVSLSRYGLVGKSSYRAEIHVVYQASGQSFTCTRFVFGPRSSASNASIDRTLAEYPVGKEVQVYFDPQDPGSSVCKPGANWSFLAYLVSIALGMYGGVACLIQARAFD